jgi:hypothetical protein
LSVHTFVETQFGPEYRAVLTEVTDDLTLREFATSRSEARIGT